MVSSAPSGPVQSPTSTQPSGVPAGGGIFDGSYGEAFGTSVLAPNTWTHLAVTYDGSALPFYTNGVLVRTITGVANHFTSTGGLKLGGNSVWGEYFKGLIDEVRVVY